MKSLLTQQESCGSADEALLRARVAKALSPPVHLALPRNNSRSPVGNACSRAVHWGQGNASNGALSDVIRPSILPGLGGEGNSSLRQVPSNKRTLRECRHGPHRARVLASNRRLYRTTCLDNARARDALGLVSGPRRRRPLLRRAARLRVAISGIGQRPGLVSQPLGLIAIPSAPASARPARIPPG
jgi:hypothetical protein